MFSKLHDRVGTAGLIVAIVALVVALSGTAVAASGALSGKQKKEVEKIAKKYAGKNGKNGAPGANGSTGPAGAAGKTGSDGSNGTNGTNGSNGKSVVVTEIAAEEEECGGRGGSEVAQEGAAGVEVCNGKEGSPWTAGGTLPSGKTETGVWNISLAKEQTAQVPISFTLPVSGTIEPILVEGASAPGCPGASGDKPSAEAGKLCLYQFKVANGELEEAAFLKPLSGSAFPEPGVDPSGTILAVECISTSAPCVRFGAWAVTAP